MPRKPTFPRRVRGGTEYVRIRCNGQQREVSLGPAGDPGNDAEYRRLIRELEIQGGIPVVPKSGLLVAELLVAYLESIAAKPPDQQARIKLALRAVKELYGATPAADFGPVALASVRNQFIEAGWTKGYVGQCTSCVARVWRWAARTELLPWDCYNRLRSIAPLDEVDAEITPSRKVRPVRPEVLEATLKHLGQIPADLVRMITAPMRPDEACKLKPCLVDRTGRDQEGRIWQGLWVYCPEKHKTQQHGIDRTILLGPRSQATLLPYLDREPDCYCFSPREAMRRFLQANGRKIRHGKKRTPGDRYSLDALAHALRKACRRAGVENWTAKQAEKLGTNRIYQHTGDLSAVQGAKSHVDANTTVRYVLPALAAAADALREIG